MTHVILSCPLADFGSMFQSPPLTALGHLTKNYGSSHEHQERLFLHPSLFGLRRSSFPTCFSRDAVTSFISVVLNVSVVGDSTIIFWESWLMLDSLYAVSFMTKFCRFFVFFNQNNIKPN